MLQFILENNYDFLLLLMTDLKKIIKLFALVLDLKTLVLVFISIDNFSN